MTRTYQLKVSLRGTKPPVWRRVAVPGNLSLDRLHRVIQDAMGWYDSHLHSFTIHGTDFGVPDQDDWGFGPEMESEKKYKLEDLVGEKDRFSYTYDFGDDWVHAVLVEKVTPAELATPRCIAGARACPPEDCGGVWGYAELLDAHSDVNHEHAELGGWVPTGWVPDRFDLVLADRLVAKHGARRTRTKKQPARGWVRARP